jgi:hypothetical protein
MRHASAGTRHASNHRSTLLTLIRVVGYASIYAVTLPAARAFPDRQSGSQPVSHTDLHRGQRPPPPKVGLSRRPDASSAAVRSAALSPLFCQFRSVRSLRVPDPNDEVLRSSITLYHYAVPPTTVRTDERNFRSSYRYSM